MFCSAVEQQRNFMWRDDSPIKQASTMKFRDAIFIASWLEPVDGTSSTSTVEGNIIVL